MQKEKHLKLSRAVLNLIEANNVLDEAKQNIPSYTGQYSVESYYEDEEKMFVAASEDYSNAILDLILDVKNNKDSLYFEEINY